MRGLLRYFCALLAVIGLMGAAFLALAGWMTSASFIEELNGTKALRDMQQERIDAAAKSLQETWQLAPEVLAPWTEDAADKQTAAVAAWWGAIWSDLEADLALPAWLDSEEEAILVADIRRDEGFISLTEADRRRAIARDDVAYALDVAVCDAVTPLRRGIVELGLALAAERVNLPLVRRMMLIGAGGLLGISLALLIAARRMAGSALIAAGTAMLAAVVPVALADIPGMLAQLNPIAAVQGKNALLCMGILWGGAALALLLLGWVILAIKRWLWRDDE